MQIEATDLEQHRAALTGHCYRMLGSVADAEDAVQETIIRAWKNLDRFEGRASLKTWLHKIATNVCLDELSDGHRRMRPLEEGPVGTINHPLETRERQHWLEPIPDAMAIPADASPHEAAVLRQSIRLAFVAALQHLPARQRACLLLTEVLGWSAAEAAESLEMTVAAVNSALQRARATLGSRAKLDSRAALSEEAAESLEMTVAAVNSALQRARATLGNRAKLDSRAALSEEEAEAVERYADAFHRYDVDALAALLREDATMSMPPYTLWLQGTESIKGWLTGPGCGCRGSKLIRVEASGWPAFAQYRASAEGGYHAWGLIVLEVDGARIKSWNSFLDVETLFPRFGLPLRLSA